LYLPTLKGKWLFQGIRKDSHAKDETLNIALRGTDNSSGYARSFSSLITIGVNIKYKMQLSSNYAQLQKTCTYARTYAWCCDICDSWSHDSDFPTDEVD
jgi:hypothetical protein